MNDLTVFYKLGFEIVENQNDKLTVLFSQGKDFGIYLEIQADVFSVECVCNPFSNKIFQWQHYDNFEEIAALLIKNHILSEQIFEKAGLAVYT